jgi:aminoglycoside N3'-acetyltransferase
MQSYTTEQLRTALEALGIEQGTTLLVHSSLLHLGRTDGRRPAEVPASIFDLLFEMVGREGTVVVPTFTFAFCRGTPFDRQRSPSENMGVFSEYVRTHPAALRSAHPMQSVSALGRSAELICTPDTISSFSDGGPFDVLLRLDAQVLLLGATMQAVSLVHYAEEREHVPYRYWKDFCGEWKDREILEQRTYRMFVRDLQRDPRLNLSVLHRELDDMGAIKSVAVGGGRVELFSAGSFVETARKQLAADPLILVENREQFT